MASPERTAATRPRVSELIEPDRPLHLRSAIVLSAFRILGVRFAIALVAASVVLAGMVTAVNWQLDSRIAGIERVDVTVDTTPRPAEAGNYLVVGSDSREFVDGDNDLLEAFGDPGGDRADSIMVAHIEPEERQVLLVAIPRDTAVDLPDGARSKIADVFSDGPQALIDVIDANFGVPVTHYLNVDFAGFDRIVDLVGPVTVHFNAPARDEMSGLFIDRSGCVPLDSEDALAYVRSRFYEERIFERWVPDPTADFGRIQRQQAFLRQLALLARDEIYESPLEVPGIVDAALDTLRADRAFGRDQILGFIDRFRDVDPYDPASVEMITLPVVEGPPGTALGSYLELDVPAADEVLARLREFGPADPLPDEVARPPTTTVPPELIAPEAGSSPGEGDPAWPDIPQPLPDAIQPDPDAPPTPICS